MFSFKPPNVEVLQKNHDVSGLIKALQYPKDGAIRRDAATALGQLGDRSAGKHLARALKDEISGVRCYAAEALGLIGDPASFSPLIQALQDDDADVRGYAAEALGKLGDPKACEPLMEILRNEHSHWRVSDGAILGLGELHDPRALDLLLEKFRPNPYEYDQTSAIALIRFATRTSDPEIFARIMNEVYPYADSHDYMDVDAALVKMEEPALEYILLHSPSNRGMDIIGKMGKQTQNLALLDKIAQSFIELFKSNDYSTLKKLFRATDKFLPRIQNSIHFPALTDALLQAIEQRYLEYLSIDKSLDWDSIPDILKTINTPRAASLLNLLADAWFEAAKTVSGGSGSRYTELSGYGLTLRFNPGHVRCLANQGITYCQVNEWQKGLESFDHALAIDPNCERAVLNRWIPLWNLGRYDDALAALDKAIPFDSDLSKTREELLVKLKR